MLDGINDDLASFGIKIDTNSEYVSEYLDEITDRYAKIYEIDETKFVYGKGHRKTPQQRYYECLQKYTAKLKEYVEKIKVCGPDWNSYSKTDHCATFMRI